MKANRFFAATLFTATLSLIVTAPAMAVDEYVTRSVVLAPGQSYQGSFNPKEGKISYQNLAWNGDSEMEVWGAEKGFLSNSLNWRSQDVNWWEKKIYLRDAFVYRFQNTGKVSVRIEVQDGLRPFSTSGSGRAMEPSADPGNSACLWIRNGWTPCSGKWTGYEVNYLYFPSNTTLTLSEVNRMWASVGRGTPVFYILLGVDGYAQKAVPFWSDAQRRASGDTWVSGAGVILVTWEGYQGAGKPALTFSPAVTAGKIAVINAAIVRAGTR